MLKFIQLLSNFPFFFVSAVMLHEDPSVSRDYFSEGWGAGILTGFRGGVEVTFILGFSFWKEAPGERAALTGVHAPPASL